MPPEDGSNEFLVVVLPFRTPPRKPREYRNPPISSGASRPNASRQFSTTPTGNPAGIADVLDHETIAADAPWKPPKTEVLSIKNARQKAQQRDHQAPRLESVVIRTHWDGTRAAAQFTPRRSHSWRFRGSINPVVVK